MECNPVSDHSGAWHQDSKAPDSRSNAAQGQAQVPQVGSQAILSYCQRQTQGIDIIHGILYPCILLHKSYLILKHCVVCISYLVFIFYFYFLLSITIIHFLLQYWPAGRNHNSSGKNRRRLKQKRRARYVTGTPLKKLNKMMGHW